MSVWIHCQKRETNQIYTVLYSPSGNTELIEHELLKIKLSKSHQYCYRQTPTSVKKLLAFQSPIFHNLSPSGWETLCLHWRLPYFSKAASCLNVCKWNDVLKLTALFAGRGGGLLFGSKWPYSRISTDTAGRKTCKFANSPIQSLSIREHPELPKPYSYLKPVWCIISPLECRWGYSVGNSACLRYVYHLAALCHGDKEAYSLISYRGRTEAQLFDMTSQGPT